MTIIRSASLLALLTLLIAGGCREARDAGADRGTTVVMGVPGANAIKPDTWANLDFLVFLPLATFDERGELEGRLARSWEHSTDFNEWTYHLRTDVRWNDDKPVTARDVKFTLDLLADVDPEYTDIKATFVNDSTVRIRAPKPNYIADIVYYPEHLLKSLDRRKFRQWGFWTQPVGNGPFRFIRHLPGRLIELEANRSYHRGRPRIERVVLKFVGEAGLTELLSGSVDIIRGKPAEIPLIAKDPRFRVYREMFEDAWSLYWKADHPLFRDPRVRRALTHALNRREMLGVMNSAPDAPITDAVLTTRQFRRREWPKPLAYDTAFARTLFAAAGWVDRNGDGILDKDGRPFRFTASVGPLGSDKLAVYVQAQLRRMGVQMDMQLLDVGLMEAKLRTGDFEAWIHLPSWSWRRDSGRGNQLGYANVEAFELIERLEKTSDPEEEDRIHRKLSEVFRADPPMVRLVPLSREWFAHRRILGLSTPFQHPPGARMEDLWVDGER